MVNLTNIIRNNSNINMELKDKIIECVELIVKKYPITYRNLYNNLETITIQYTDSIEKEKLEKVGADSYYNCGENLLLLNKQKKNSEHYKNLVIHELLHVASYNEINMGFESLYAKKGLSFNEGMTEFLTQEILNNHSFGMAKYVNDINNIILLSSIIPFEKLISLYFTNGLLGIIQEYINTVGKGNNLNSLIAYMDKEHCMRIRKNKFDNEYKDKYVKLFVDDVSKINFDNDKKTIDTIRLINNFIRCQYKTKTVPPTIKKSIETSLNTIFSKSNIEKGQIK